MPYMTYLERTLEGAPFVLPLLILLTLWTLTIKGVALWHTARDGQKVWFIALLIVNTLGILEVVYLLFFRKKGETKEVVSV